MGIFKKYAHQVNAAYIPPGGYISSKDLICDVCGKPLVFVNRIERPNKWATDIEEGLVYKHAIPFGGAPIDKVLDSYYCPCCNISFYVLFNR